MPITIQITLFLILPAVIIALLGLFFVSTHYAWFSKNKIKLLVLLALLGIILYAVIEARCLPINADPADYMSIVFISIYNMFRLFILEMDVPDPASPSDLLPLAFGLVSFGILLTMSTIIISFVGYRSLCRIRMQCIALLPQKKPTYLFTSLNEKALILAEDIAKSPSRIVFLMGNTPMSYLSEDDMENDKEVIKRILKQGYYILDMPHELTPDELNTSPDDRKKSKLSLPFRIIAKLRNVTIFANGKNEHENVLFVYSLAKILGTPKHPITLCPFVTNNDYDTLWEDPVMKDYPRRILDENDLAVRQLFDRDGLNLAKCIKPDNTLTVLVSGYSDISSSLYTTLAYMGQFDGVIYKLILVNDTIEDDTSWFFIENPEIRKCIQIESLPLKPGSLAYFDYIRENMASIDCIIHTNEDLLLAGELLRLRSFLSCHTAICLYAPSHQQYHLLFDCRRNDYVRNLFLFGSIRKVYTKKIILDEELDTIAKCFNNVYSDVPLDEEGNWNTLDLFSKQSNRALALQTTSKLYRIGIDCVYIEQDKDKGKDKGNSNSKGSGEELYQEKIADTSVIESLARGEHMRWNAFSFANGWRTKTEYDPKVYASRKDSANRLHALLVDWEDLGELGLAFQRDFRKLDYDMLERTGEVLVTAGYTLKTLPKGSDAYV